MDMQLAPISPLYLSLSLAFSPYYLSPSIIPLVLNIFLRFCSINASPDRKSVV